MISSFHPERVIEMAKSSDEKKFKEMTAAEKVIFLGKFIVFLCTFGFAFPLILHDEDYVRKFR